MPRCTLDRPMYNGGEGKRRGRKGGQKGRQQKNERVTFLGFKLPDCDHFNPCSTCTISRNSDHRFSLRIFV